MSRWQRLSDDAASPGQGASVERRWPRRGTTVDRHVVRTQVLTLSCCQEGIVRQSLDAHLAARTFLRLQINEADAESLPAWAEGDPPGP